jgi:hypothetical protein
MTGSVYKCGERFRFPEQHGRLAMLLTTAMVSPVAMTVRSMFAFAVVIVIVMMMVMVTVMVTVMVMVLVRMARAVLLSMAIALGMFLVLDSPSTC